MKIAIMGFGVVGSGVGEIVVKNQERLREKCGEAVEVAHILDLRDFPDSDFKCFTKDFNDILNDPETGVVVEAMGGCNPAYKFTKELLLGGKHVITSNKELVATHGTELLAIAKEKGVNYLFEASVGGGIPVLRPIFSSLTAGETTQVMGILNGTTNYILTQMFESGKTFDAALKEAQQKGYAESDPTADVEGHDTCRKIAILSALSYGREIKCERIPTEGISSITAQDVAYAEKSGCSIKLLGHSTKTQNGVFAAVFPAFVPYTNQLSHINDVFNGVVVKNPELDEVMFYGRGAGMLPTANAVVSDVIDAIKNKSVNIGVNWKEYDEKWQSDGADVQYKYYIRVKGDAVYGDGFDTVVLDGSEYAGEFALITKPQTAAELDAFIADKLSGKEILGQMRMIG